jgi:hypothetical protein
MPEQTRVDSWSDWANYVLMELKRLAAETNKIPLIEKDIAILQPGNKDEESIATNII